MILANEFTLTFSTAEVLTAAGLAFVALGALMATGRLHINRRVDLKLEESVADAVKRHVEIVDLKMDTMLINQRETSEALGKVHDLEVTINNGLIARVGRIESKLDDVLAWKGLERRST